MNRKQKIELLRSLRTGMRSVKSLRNGSVYIVNHILEKDIYSVEIGSATRLLSPSEFHEFRKELEAHNNELIPGNQIRNAIILTETNSD